MLQTISYRGAEWTIGHSLTENVPRSIMTRSYSVPVVKTGSTINSLSDLCWASLPLARRPKQGTSPISGGH
jgi:hypothetical protein